MVLNLTIFMLRSEVPSQITGNCDKLQIPRCKTSLAQQVFHYREVCIWISLPNNITEIDAVTPFKESLKKASHGEFEVRETLPNNC